MTKKKIIDLVERAAWTFAQAFLSAWAVVGFQFDKVALIGAIAAAFSAFKTFVKESL